MPKNLEALVGLHPIAFVRPLTSLPQKTHTHRRQGEAEIVGSRINRGTPSAHSQRNRWQHRPTSSTKYVVTAPVTNIGLSMWLCGHHSHAYAPDTQSLSQDSLWEVIVGVGLVRRRCQLAVRIDA